MAQHYSLRQVGGGRLLVKTKKEAIEALLRVDGEFLKPLLNTYLYIVDGDTLKSLAWRVARDLEISSTKDFEKCLNSLFFVVHKKKMRKR